MTAYKSNQNTALRELTDSNGQTYEAWLIATSRTSTDNSATLVTSQAVTYRDWTDILEARRAESEGNYANETNDIAATQDRQRAISFIRDQQASVYLHDTAHALLGNPDRGLIAKAHPRTHKDDPDPAGPYAAEALWNSYRRTLREGSFKSLQLMHALTDAYHKTLSRRPESDPSMDIDADINLEGTAPTEYFKAADRREHHAGKVESAPDVRIPDEIITNDKIAVVSASTEEAQVVVDTMKFVEKLSLSLAGKKALDHWPHPQVIDGAFHEFRPLTTAILEEHEIVALIGTAYKTALPSILSSMETDGRTINVPSTSIADSINAYRDEALEDGHVTKYPLRESNNDFIAKAEQHETMIANSHRVIVIWNGEERDMALHAINTAASLGRPVDIFNKSGISLDTDKVLAIAKEQYPNARARVRNEWDTNFVQLGRLDTPQAQVYLSTRTSPQIAAALTQAQYSAADLLAASTNQQTAAAIAAKIGTTSKTIADIVPTDDPNRHMLQRLLRRAEETVKIAQATGFAVLSQDKATYPSAAKQTSALLYIKGNTALLADDTMRTLLLDDRNGAHTLPPMRTELLHPAKRVAIEGATPQSIRPAAITIIPYPPDQMPSDVADKVASIVAAKGLVISPITPGSSTNYDYSHPNANFKPTEEALGKAAQLAAALADNAVIIHGALKGPSATIAQALLSAEKPVAFMAPSSKTEKPLPISPLGDHMAKAVATIDRMTSSMADRSAQANRIQHAINPDSDAFALSKNQRTQFRADDEILARMDQATFQKASAQRKHITIIHNREDAGLKITAFLNTHNRDAERSHPLQRA